MRKTQIDLKTLILDHLKNTREIKVSDVAKISGLSKSNERDRKAIRRALTQLVKQGLLKAQGSARARLYVYLNTGPTQTEEPSKAFHGIPLSTESQHAFKYISQPLQMRIPVGYNQDFLRSYIPNQTFYLTEQQRSELQKMGTVEHQQRPAGTYARNILNRLLIDLSWNSSRLEGNTYSLLETKRLIELGETASGKDASEAQMILNHKNAIEYITETTLEEQITPHSVLSIHALLSENLLGDPSASGRIRQISVGIGGTTYLPLENPHILNECFQLLIQKLTSIKNPFEQSFFAFVHLSYLQAFEDVNKRTARLVANTPLIQKNLRPLCFIDVNREIYLQSLLSIYEKNDISLLRDLYLWAYSRSVQRYSAIQQTLGEPNLLKIKYRSYIQEIIQTLILKEIAGSQLVAHIKNQLEIKKIPKTDLPELFTLIETEIMSLHDGNIARFKIRPSEFQKWKILQS